MDDDLTNSTGRNADGTRPRRIVFIGAGPLPEAGSAFAPGVANRLWHFLQPALAAGHDCLLLSIEADAPPLPGAGGAGENERANEPEIVHEQSGRAYRRLRVRAEDCLAVEHLAQVINVFNPDAFAGAGTILAAWTACQLAGDRPVWADFFGDPLAEIEIKTAVLGRDASLDEHLNVWRKMLDILRRADAFSVVSRRQADALLGQLVLAGRGQNPDMIHFMPCALESLDLFLGQPAPGRAGRWASAGLPEDALVALWSGGFNAWADPATLVRGVELAMDREPRLHLVATGGELPGYLGRVYEQFQTLIAASRHAGRLHALGWRPQAEANEWLRMADLALLIDRPCAETRLGARNRLLYHAAARCPVVASRGVEAVADMEAAGALAAFPTGDAEALCAAILGLLADPGRCDGLGLRSLAWCTEHYTFGASAAPFLEFCAIPLAPARSDPESGGTLEASRWIGKYLDIPARDAEWNELERYRSGRLARLRRFIRGDASGGAGGDIGSGEEAGGTAFNRAIGRYFKHTRTYSTVRFIIELALITYPFKIILGLLWTMVTGHIAVTNTEVLAQHGTGKLVLAALVLAPMIETFIGQWLPLWVLGFITRRQMVLVWGSAIFFALQHYNGGVAGILGVLPVAVLLSWSFLMQRSRSFWRACWVTAAIHGLHNALAVGLYLLARTSLPGGAS